MAICCSGLKRKHSATGLWPGNALGLLLETSSVHTRFCGTEYQNERGFLVWRQIADEAEILSLGVAPAFRRIGIARMLLAGLHEWSRASGMVRTVLDVAADNCAALALYERHGYHEIGRRRRYYRSGADAIVMARPAP